jgi:hypothetical protein
MNKEEIKEKKTDIEDIVSSKKLDLIGKKLANPGRVICPLFRRYIIFPVFPCTGYHYVCQFLSDDVRCSHPDA